MLGDDRCVYDRCVLTTEGLGMKPRNCGMRKTLPYLIALYQLRLTFKEQFNDYLLIWMFNSKRANNVVKKYMKERRDYYIMTVQTDL